MAHSISIEYPLGLNQKRIKCKFVHILGQDFELITWMRL